ncbi:MAG: hypothetical protein ABEJ62_00745 [Candidatus Nanohaloarchaea archaeon]
MRKRICPNCGSTDIGTDTTSVISRLSLSGSLECRECGYNGIFPEVDEEGLEEAREEIEERDLEDASVQEEFAWSRAGLGLLLLLLGAGATSYATWGNGLLAGLLALAIGASVVFGEITKAYS